MNDPRSDAPFKVGILGATGLVGQRLVERLSVHPWFEIEALAASDRSVGRPYGQAARWALSSAPPSKQAECEVVPCDVRACAGCDLMFSALDADIARDVERAFAEAGLPVVSNSSAYRQAEDVPLLIPEVNPEQLSLLERQRARHGGGYIVTNPNCSVVGLVMTLAALERAFGVRRVVVVTLQALSGAGIDGPGSLAMLDNVLPWIPGEEEKLAQETVKLLGRVEADGVRGAEIQVSAHCHRVGTLDGHLQAVSVELRNRASDEDARAAFRGFAGAIADLRLPSAPRAPIELREEADRPQPRLDRDAGAGMTVVVGRVRPCPVLGLRYELLVHNTIRGAAGAAVLNAELLVARRLVPRRSRP